MYMCEMFDKDIKIYTKTIENKTLYNLSLWRATVVYNKFHR